MIFLERDDDLINIAIVGGGASGVMAAISAANQGADVTIFERNEKLMKKLFITGKGRCNLTNDAIYDEFLKSIVRGQKFFLSSFNSFDNYSTMDFFEQELGLPIKVERGGRVFPASDKSSDVIKVLNNALKKLNVNVVLDYKVNTITKKDEVFVVNNKHEFDKIIISGGGASYASTGSDGNMYQIIRDLGHNVTDIIPSLTALKTKELNLNELQGISLNHVELCAKLNKKTIFNDLGEMIFTHFGISGPLVLSLSAYINRSKFNDYTIYIDLKPALSEEKIYDRIIRDFTAEPKRTMKNVLRRLLPAGLINEVLKKSEIDGETICNQVNATKRRTLAKTLKMFIIEVEDFYKLDQAIITRGGVSLKEVSPSTMESKIIEGLYFSGEILDIDALTGGYNLQVAFSTGHSAGKNSAI